MLGSDDAIASTASLMIGDGAASATKEAILYALVTIAALLVAPAMFRTPLVAAASLVSLAALGAFGGHLGGAPMLRASLRVTVGGGMAMAVTAAIGRLLGVAVG